MTKPDFNYYSIQQLLELWSEHKITIADLRQYGAEGKLQFLVKWNDLRENSFNLQCSIKDEWLDISPEDIKKPGDINFCNIRCKDNSNCKFDPPEIYLQETSDEERDNLGKLICSFKDLFVSHDDFQTFDMQFSSATKRSISQKDDGDINPRRETTLLKVIGAFLVLHYDKRQYLQDSGKLNASKIYNDITKNLSDKQYNLNGLSDRTLRDLIPDAYDEICENLIRE